MVDKPQTREELKKEFADNAKVLDLSVSLSSFSLEKDKVEESTASRDKYFHEVSKLMDQQVGMLSVNEIYSKENRDGQLTEEDILTTLANVQAFEKDGVVLDDAKELVEKYKSDPDLIKEAKTAFAKLTRDFPDGNNDHNSININDAAAKELEFLTKVFPENMKKANEEIQKDSAATLTPLETLNKVAEVSKPSVPGH